MSFNKIILLGNIGRDPDLKYTTTGQAVCSFSLATSERRKDKVGEPQETTTWFRITLWGKQAEIASKYLSKGRAVYIEGRLRLEEWQDRDGKTRQSLEVTATDMQFVGSAESNSTGTGVNETREAAAKAKAAAAVLEPDEEVPF
jgi:single-strand DNA-binding protein